MPLDPDDFHPYELLLREFFRSQEADLDAQATVFNLYRTATDVIAAMEAQALKPYGLTHAGFVLLMTLWITGAREIRELAGVQRVSRPAIVSAVSTLERAGLVRRVRTASDRRLVHVELTPRGRTCIERVHATQHRFECAVSSALNPAEQQTLTALLRRLDAAALAMDEAATQGTPVCAVSAGSPATADGDVRKAAPKAPTGYRRRISPGRNHAARSPAA
jgi:DNA-binding MarR family transcriptional regulator